MAADVADMFHTFLRTPLYQNIPSGPTVVQRTTVATNEDFWQSGVSFVGNDVVSVVYYKKSSMLFSI